MRLAHILGIATVLAGGLFLAFLWWPEPDQPEHQLIPPSSSEPVRERIIAPEKPEPPLAAQTQAPDEQFAGQSPEDDDHSGPRPDISSEMDLSEQSREEDQPLMEANATVSTDSASDQNTARPIPVITPAFCEDLAQVLVDAYHPPRSVHNPDVKGTLNLHFSSLNRRYGLDMTGLDIQAASVTEAREKIFSSLLRPAVIEAGWAVFAPVLSQALHRSLEEAIRSFANADGTLNQRPLTPQERDECLALLAATTVNIAAAMEQYLLHEQAYFLTQQWLQAQTKTFAAHSRYQHADAALENARNPFDGAQDREQEPLKELRGERDAAAQGIMQAVAAKEEARQAVLSIFPQEAKTGLSDPALLYLAEWLGRRLHTQPDHADALLIVADKLRDLSARLRSS